MSPVTAALVCVALMVSAVTAYDLVVSGVFQSSGLKLNYTQAQEYCRSQNAEMATLENVTTANKGGFQTCRWGWLVDQQVVISRTSLSDKCANDTGVIIKRPCSYARAMSAYCYRPVALHEVYQILSPELKMGFTFKDAKSICEFQGTTMATKEQLKTALQNGYETCRAGWVNESEIVMPRIHSVLSCAKGDIGLLQLSASNTTSSVFCFQKGLIRPNFQWFPSNQSLNYTGAQLLCSSNGYQLATEEQVQIFNVSVISPGWTKNQTVVSFSGGSLRLAPCIRESSDIAEAYCYNQTVPDFTQVPDNKLWLKITMGCILTTIFLTLLLTAIFMRGNQCICCQNHKTLTKDSALQRNEGFASVPGMYLPNWNTGAYRPQEEAIYERPLQSPFIKPSMLDYHTHFFSKPPRSQVEVGLPLNTFVDVNRTHGPKTYVAESQHQYDNLALDVDS
ncbi:aggrecan core protein-like [Erpetoichthys calabaricus]|uniref:aggrecan core protein-like n=1 Tax=Erpetoichthys calabaricus TaxID=27687 RepID=UPI0010A0721C|nr:aggrecan core protein-like [Erpetoichthys calabaricus]